MAEGKERHHTQNRLDSGYNNLPEYSKSSRSVNGSRLIQFPRNTSHKTGNQKDIGRLAASKQQGKAHHTAV